MRPKNPATIYPHVARTVPPARPPSRTRRRRRARIDIDALNAYYGTFRAVRDVSCDPPQADHRHHRTVRLRQEHLAALAQPDARVDRRRARRGQRSCSTARHLRRRRRPGRAAAGDRHGVPAPEPVPDDVDLRQRRRRSAPDRAASRDGPRRARRAEPPAGGALGRGQGQAQGATARRCPAASSSASASPARSPSSRRSS